MPGRFLAVTAALFQVVTINAALAAGPDVILGEIDGSVSKLINGEVYAGFGTTSCNAGDVPLNWKALPSNEHPVIGLNLYRLSSGRMVQLGQSWLKHGTFALEHDICNLGCQPTNSGSKLGPGCSDPYGATMNRGPYLGARSDVNALTGAYDGVAVDNELSQISGTGWERSLQVRVEELQVPGAEYFVEGHYVTKDDAEAGNGLNNVSFRKVAVIESDGEYYFATQDKTVREKPALSAWKDAKLQQIDSVELTINGKPITSRLMLGANTVDLGNGRHRYEYAIYNLNSARAVSSFSVNLGNVSPENVGFHAVAKDGVPSVPWVSSVSDGKITWTSTPDSNGNVNAIEWGNTYNFWFEANAAPGEVDVQAQRFRAGTDDGLIKLRALGPK